MIMMLFHHNKYTLWTVSPQHLFLFGRWEEGGPVVMLRSGVPWSEENKDKTTCKVSENISPSFYLMTSILPAERDVHRTPLRRGSPVSSSLGVNGLCRVKQAHPEIHNANKRTLGALDGDRAVIIKRMKITVHYVTDKSNCDKICRMKMT